jgi:hypothetical protein
MPAYRHGRVNCLNWYGVVSSNWEQDCAVLRVSNQGNHLYGTSRQMDGMSNSGGHYVMLGGTSASCCLD